MEKQIPNSASLDPAVRHALDWVRRYADSLVVAGDHGGLTGLADDDHPQYLNNARGDVRYLTAATAAATYQPLDADLTAIAALVTTAHGRGLLTGADAAATRAALGLGSLATLSSVGSAEITNDSIMNADINSAAGIVDTKLATIGTANKVDLAAVNINGGTEYGTTLGDTDTFACYAPGAVANRKVLSTRIPQYVFTKVTTDITISSAGVATIASNAVSNTKLADMATATFKGRTTAGTGDPEDLTAAQATAMLNNFTSALKGLVPLSGGGTTNYLRADGTWAVPPGAGGTAPVYNANTADVVASAADTYLTGSALSIGTKVKAGTILRWRLAMTKSAAGVAAPVFSFRFGTAGTTADTARASFTGVAQTAATDTGFVDISMVVRNAGVSGQITVTMNMEHFNTTTGLANKAQAQIFQGSSGAFDLTGATLIAGLSVNPGASGVWTFQVVTAEAVNLV